MSQKPRNHRNSTGRGLKRTHSLPTLRMRNSWEDPSSGRWSAKGIRLSRERQWCLGGILPVPNCVWSQGRKAFTTGTFNFLIFKMEVVDHVSSVLFWEPWKFLDVKTNVLQKCPQTDPTGGQPTLAMQQGKTRYFPFIFATTLSHCSHPPGFACLSQR